jgi:hypothetical protein
MSSKIFLLFLGLLVLGIAESAPAQKEPESVIYTMKNCVDFARQGDKFVFNSKAALEATFWTGDKLCPKEAGDIDFDKYTLIGVDIHNSECWGFPMQYKLIRDESAKLYRFQVTHPRVIAPCRGLYHHDLWILTPKLPEGYEVEFEIKVKEEKDESPHKC